MARVRLCVCAGVCLSGRRGRGTAGCSPTNTHVHRASACTLNAVGLLPVSGCGDARVAPPSYLTLEKENNARSAHPPRINRHAHGQQNLSPFRTAKAVPLPSNKGEKESIAGPENRPAKIVRPFRTAKAVPPSNKGENQSPEIVPPNRPPPSGFPFQHGHHACCRSCCGGRSGP